MRRALARSAAAALAAGAIAAIGCGEPRSGAVSETGPCAQVVPLARTHVRGMGSLVSVRALKRAQLRGLLKTLDEQAPPTPREARHKRVPRKGCVLVYRGSFTPGGELTGARPGRYLVLIIGVRHPHLLRGIVVDRLPPVIVKEG